MIRSVRNDERDAPSDISHSLFEHKGPFSVVHIRGTLTVVLNKFNEL